MIGCADIRVIAAGLAERSGFEPPSVYDLRIDSDRLFEGNDPEMLRHIRHQSLLRAYQARYMLLPSAAPPGSIVERLRRHYDPEQMAALEKFRSRLEADLIEPLEIRARAAAAGRDAATYSAHLLPELRAKTETPFITYVRDSPEREHHYRNFLIQSSADLLAEASASALGVVGEFGAAQSALFRILIDEFGYGVHDRKHSVLYRATMRDFGLCDEYNAYWPLFDTSTLELHNTIHYLFQNPRNFFMQIGFLLFAETAYQRSTQDHFRYLREFHPHVDARYFGEHAHIDLHHTQMMVDEVVMPLIATYGEEAGHEIVVGAELTRQVFDTAGSHLLACSGAFDAAVKAGHAMYAMPDQKSLGHCITPGTAASFSDSCGRIQVGGLGVLETGSVFKNFPMGAIGRSIAPER